MSEGSNTLSPAAAPTPGHRTPRATMSQTLSRGLQALEVLCQAGGPVAVNDVGAKLGVHRSVAYRLLRTLEDHGLARREEHGFAPARGLRQLVEAAEAPQQRLATPILQGVVDDLGVTAFLVVAEHDLCVTRACVEARREGANLVQRPGTAHPLTHGAPGIALLVALGDEMSQEQLAAHAGDRLGDVAAARSRGWASSFDEVIPSVRSVAVPVRGAVGWPAALAVVFLGEDVEEQRAAHRLHTAAQQLAHSSRR